MDLAVALRAFVRTVERGSMTAAARDLSVSQPAITKHLRNLERHVGARLLERSPRAVRPTPQGLALYEASSTALATIDAAMEGVRRDMGAIEGRLRVHAPCCIGAKHVHPTAMAFRTLHPGVSVDLVLENRSVDLVHENYDLAVKFGRPEAGELVVRRLGLVRRILVAAPAFLAAEGPVDSLERLKVVPLVATPNVLSPRDELALSHDGRSLDLPVKPVLRTNSPEVLLATLVAGHAAGPVQRHLVGDELADGRLVRILPDYEVRPAEAFLAYPSVRFLRPAVRAFADHLVAALRRVDGIDTGC